MSKTILAIVGIGIAGCLLLSLTMRQLVQHQLVQREAPGLPAVSARFAERLAGPLAMHEEHHGMSTRLVVSGRAASNEDQQSLAGAIAAEVWQTLGADDSGTDVMVKLRDAQGRTPVSTVTARPSPARCSASPPWHGAIRATPRLATGPVR